MQTATQTQHDLFEEVLPRERRHPGLAPVEQKRQQPDRVRDRYEDKRVVRVPDRRTRRSTSVPSPVRLRGATQDRRRRGRGSADLYLARPRPNPRACQPSRRAGAPALRRRSLERPEKRCAFPVSISSNEHLVPGQ
jgi:hypothetical protein